MDKDCVAMLKKMYGSDNGSTKQDLMEYGDLLTNIFWCEEKGKEVLEADLVWSCVGHFGTNAHLFGTKPMIA
jgi:hypothetical protein